MAEPGTLQSVVGHWLPRMHTAGLAPSDLDRVIAATGEWRNWCRAFCDEAGRHAMDGHDAETRGYGISAGEAYVRAALFYHFGQFMFFDDLEQKRCAAEARVRIFWRGARLFAHPSEPVAIPYRDGVLRAYLRLPPITPAPLAILIPGSDSTKEEFWSLERYFLDRGLATLSVDGPGQGEGRSFGQLTPNWRTVLAAIREVVTDLAGIDRSRVGLMGMAFGGHLALQGAAGFPELKAVISMNGFYDLGNFWDDLPDIYRRNMRYALGGADPGETGVRAARFSLKGVEPPACPILIIHGGRDRIFPICDIRRLTDFGGRIETVIYEEGNHVCNNIAYRYRALMADWMAERLHPR